MGFRCDIGINPLKIYSIIRDGLVINVPNITNQNASKWKSLRLSIKI